MSQEFYGNDVFTDDVVNSPFITFAPELIYALFDMPGFSLKTGISATYGICPDVTDLYLKVKPAINLMIGAFLMDLYYEVEAIRYVNGVTARNLAGMGPGPQMADETKHTIGLTAMLMF